MLRHVHTLLASAALIAAAPSTAFAQAPAPAVAKGEPEPMRFPAIGYDVNDLDRSVRPGDDFDAFVNGKWKAATEIPASYPYYGVVLDLHLGAERAVKTIIDEVSAKPSVPGSLEQRVGDMYRAYADVEAINRSGLTPVKPYLDGIAAVQSYEDLADLFAKSGYPSPFGEGVSIDRGDPTRNIAFVEIGGIGLPDRDNYLIDNDRNREIRGKYIDYLAFLLTKTGHASPRAAATSIYDLEKRMAAVMWDRAIARNPQLTTNRLSHGELVALAGSFPLDRYLAARGFLPSDPFNVSNVPPTLEEVAEARLTPPMQAKLGGGYPGMMKLITDTPLDLWKAWMATRLLSDQADILPREIDDARFAFFGEYLQGRKAQRERWQRATTEADGALGEAIGKIYVDRHFPPQSKAAMEELIGNLRMAMAENLKTLPWMTPATRAAAQTKLDALRVKIGYPSKFETYEGLGAISPTDPMGNRIAAAKWQWAKELSDLRKPVDREKWLLTPQTVNAYYMATANEMAYPAAYLQAPNFSAAADPAINYGAIGATIGHEIGHGFDDKGSRYDGTGQLKNWWTAEDKQTFEKLGARLVAQYDAICPIDDAKTCINGKLTLGENIGDLGGLSMAYKAYQISLGGKKAPVIDGLTGDQRFFISYAQHQRGKYRDDFLRQLIQTDPHSPDFARINAVLRNFDPWYAAFGVKPGDKMYLPPAQRVRIW